MQARITTLSELREHLFAGAVAWRYSPDGSIGGMSYQCACGCGHEAYLGLSAGRWDGNHLHPTINRPIGPATPCGTRWTLSAGDWISQKGN